MKKTLYLIIAVLIGWFVCDRIGGKLLLSVHQHSNSITAFKYRHLFDDCKEKMILMGTSRCEAHYIPKILEDSLKMTIYNGGVDASDNIYSQYIALCLMLRHHTPEYICLDLWGYDFEKEEDPFHAISYLAPYIGLSAEADSVFAEAGTLWKYKLSLLYRYNSKFFSDIFGYFISYENPEQKGVILKEKPAVLPRRMGDRIRQGKIDSLKVRYLNKFADKCKENNIKLICMISPSFRKTNKESYKFLYDWTKERHIPFYNYESMNMFLNNSEYFYDASHLDKEGATIYTKVFAHDLKLLLLK